MLYDRWQQVVRERRDETALREIASGQRWTFAQLAAAAGAWPADIGRLVHPTSLNARFILATLSAWRDRAVVCPLEEGAERPWSPELPENIVHLKLTSATTGQARLVAFTEEQLAADAANIVSTMGLRPDWPNIGVISLAHSYGFSNLVLPLLLHGIPLILPDGPLPESVRRAFDDWGDATLPAVPALWRAWHEAGVLSPRLRLAISAGAPLSVGLERSIYERSGIKIHNFYGSTECGGIAYDRSREPRSDDSCVGTPMDNVALAINDGGCLEVRSRAVGTTYWPERDSALADGCFRTSDLAALVDGNVHLRGRAGDLINVAGRKLSPEVIERELRANAAVKDCLVFGVPGVDPGRGDLIVACVVPSGAEDEASLKRFLLGRLSAWQVPKEWRFVDNLQPNERGKLSRAQWRTRLGYPGPEGAMGFEPGAPPPGPQRPPQ